MASAEGGPDSEYNSGMLNLSIAKAPTVSRDDTSSDADDKGEEEDCLDIPRTDELQRETPSAQMDTAPRDPLDPEEQNSEIEGHPIFKLPSRKSSAQVQLVNAVEKLGSRPKSRESKEGSLLKLRQIKVKAPYQNQIGPPKPLFERAQRSK